MALGKQLAGSSQLSQTFKLKTIVASKSKRIQYNVSYFSSRKPKRIFFLELQIFPTVLQRYLVNWSTSKQKGTGVFKVENE